MNVTQLKRPPSSLGAAFAAPVALRTTPFANRAHPRLRATRGARAAPRARRAGLPARRRGDARMGGDEHGPRLSDKLVDAEQDAEIDRMAEEWIGSDLARWEWYERLKSRRAKMTRNLVRQEDNLDSEVRKLHRTLLEFDSVFGTELMEGSGTKVSPAGWTLLVAVMMMYVGVGYAAVHFVVHMMTSDSEILGFLVSNVCFPV